jgi:hypothetical protein
MLEKPYPLSGYLFIYICMYIDIYLRCSLGHVHSARARVRVCAIVHCFFYVRVCACFCLCVCANVSACVCVGVCVCLKRVQTGRSQPTRHVTIHNESLSIWGGKKCVGRYIKAFRRAWIQQAVIFVDLFLSQLNQQSAQCEKR